MQVGLNTADYQVPAVDPDGNPLTYRLATLAECRGVNPSGLSISSTGLLSFNTVGKTIGHLYSAILVVEDGNTKTMLDFIIKIVGNGQPPVFVAPTPAFGSTLNATVGQQLCFTISATDPDNNFTLTASGLPVGTSANPTLPLGPGSALSTQICLTPGPNDLGTNLVIFSATDADGLQVNHVLTIEIVCPNPDPDSDGDGFTACGGDCDDNNDAIYPGATEICDGLDNDCDFAIDEGLPTTTYYSDDDGDGFGDDHHPQNFCSPPPGFVANDDDCDDECAACNPTATEICDGLDNDCDGLIDEGGVCCTAPTFTACPTAPITTNTDAGVCTAVVNYTATADGSPTPTYTYAFSGATSGSGSGTGSGAAFEKGTTTVTVTATNNCGAPVCSFTVTVLDSHNPSIVCPNNISRNTDLNQCSAIVTYASPTFSDNCTGAFLTRTSGPSTASGSAFPKGTTTVSWQVTDAVNLSTDCSFTVTVTDAQLPSITCPTNIVRSNDANQCHAVVTYADPTATDNCAVMSVLLTSPANTASGSQFPAGATTTVIWEATDNAPIPNKKTCSFTVKVNDTQKPTIACPPNKTASTDAGVCSASVTYVTPTATDNCNSPAPTVAHVSGGSAPTPSGLNSISTFDKGVTTVKWKATDAAGNTKECTFKVAVNDLEKPTMNCLSDISANNDAGLCSAVVTYTLPTFTDNCPPTSGQSVKISGPASGSGFPTGMTNVVYRATDASGNTKQCTMKVTVTDTESPSITCPGPVVVTGSGTPCTAAAIYATPTASDNCSGSLTPFLLSGLASGSSYPAGVTTNTWRAIAGNGQTTDCSFTVTVECPGGMMNGGVMNDELRGMSQHFHVSETWNVSEPALSMRLVPNPATTQVEIWIGGTGSERLGIEAAGETAGRDLSVFDAQGRMVWQRTVEIGEEMVLFDFATKNLADGLYFVMLRADGAAVLTKRLIVCNAD